jgi:hypothetical protein
MMKKRRAFVPTDFATEASLESRLVLSTAGVSTPVAQITAQVAHNAATSTSMSILSGTLGQPTTFNVTVRTAAAKGSPTGVINLVDHGQVIATLNLTPTASSSPRYATSSASYTITPQPGGPAYWFGRHAITAHFVPTGMYAKSGVTKAFVVSQPRYVPIGNGVKIATIAPGGGATLQNGQTAHVMYTGYLAKNGTIFDASLKDGGTPLTYTVGGGMLIPGFDHGSVGMKVGETRIIEIPPSQGYGSSANGPIPANSPLIFVVTLQSIG